MTPMVDTRTLGKPDVFKGDPKDYADWSFVLKAYVSCINPQYVEFVKRIETSHVPLPNRLLSDAEKALSAQLYYILVMLRKGRPLDIVQNVGAGEGAIAAVRRNYIAPK